MHFVKNFQAVVLVCLSALLSCITQAAGVDESGLGLVIERSTRDYVVNKDGSYVATFEETVRINNERGVKERAQWPLTYNQTLSTIEVLEAYTEKADGSRKAVQADQIKDQQDARSMASQGSTVGW
ncbi:MAG: hypothetical protein JWN23_2799 [Rhodocyclales bacterium]|nr:hypothetical protein [Rhodocyclales bacterium]